MSCPTFCGQVSIDRGWDTSYNAEPWIKNNHLRPADLIGKHPHGDAMYLNAVTYDRPPHRPTANGRRRPAAAQILTLLPRPLILAESPHEQRTLGRGFFQRSPRGRNARPPVRKLEGFRGFSTGSVLAVGRGFFTAVAAWLYHAAPRPVRMSRAHSLRCRLPCCAGRGLSKSHRRGIVSRGPLAPIQPGAGFFIVD